jgi:hypothetical protein
MSSKLGGHTQQIPPATHAFVGFSLCIAVLDKLSDDYTAYKPRVHAHSTHNYEPLTHTTICTSYAQKSLLRADSEPRHGVLH